MTVKCEAEFEGNCDKEYRMQLTRDVKYLFFSISAIQQSKSFCVTAQTEVQGQRSE